MRAALIFSVFLLAGCDAASEYGGVDHVWGKKGLAHGEFQIPRAMAIDDQDRLYIVDKTARIQVFDADGKFIRAWRTPERKNGRPTGLSIDREGNLLVADTHYYRVLCYSPTGERLGDKTIGGTMGRREGEFGFVTDVVEDSAGNFFVSEYGENDRIQKFSPAGDFIMQWGGHGEEVGQFRRPQSMFIDKQDRIWVADACNHRIQVFDTDGNHLVGWGEQGDAVGQLYYPYGLDMDEQGTLYVCEYGNHRVQKFTQDGKSLGTWGTSGRNAGQLFNPWSLVRDSQGRIHVIDSYNNRVQRIYF